MGTTTNPAKKHHYLPQFYLRAWTDPTGKLWCCSQVPHAGGLRDKHLSPAATAYEPGLYDAHPTTTIERVRSDEFEAKGLSPIDGAAAGAHAALLAQPEELSIEAAQAWARFINSLLERTPDVLRERDRRAAVAAEQTVADAVARYPGLARSASRLRVVGVAKNLVRQHMLRATNDQAVIDYLMGCRWLVVESNFELITGDLPLVINGGLEAVDRPINWLSIALSPERLLIVHRPEWEPDEALIQGALVAHPLSVIGGRSTRVYSRSKLEDGPVLRLRTAAEASLGRIGVSPKE